jgi:ABC-type uncharacterized transport system involved in gliding motility auxiliary subunit
VALRLRNPFAGRDGEERAGVDRRALVRGGTLGAGFLLMAALLVIVNYFGWKYHHRSDWTASQLYSLSEKTENVLAGLDRDVEAVVFLSPGDELAEPTREVLARYDAASPRFSVRTLDPERNPLEAQRLVEEHGVTAPSVVIVAGEERRVIQRDELAEFDFAGMQFGRGPEMKAYKGEQLFTAALIEIGEERKPKVRFTTGHGEIRLDELSPTGLGALAQRLRDDNFEVEEWATLGRAAVPADTDLLVVAGPSSTFVPPEVEMFDRYLAGGGRMLVLIDPVPSRTGSGELLATGLEEWLAGWGVEVGNDVVVDPANPLPFFGSETLFVTDYGSHPITRSVQEGGLPVLISLARSVGAGTVPDGYRSTVLMRTSSEGWGETDISTAEIERGEGDLAGPVPLGVVVEAEEEADGEGEGGPEGFEEFDLEGEEEVGGDGGFDEGNGAAAAAAAETEPAPGAEGAAAETAAAPSRGPMRLVVLGDSNFATDQLLRASDANVVLLIDTLNWLAERESLLGIPPKEPERVRLTLTATQMAWVLALALAILPGLAVIAGVVVWLRRRR